jgi:hypothetical protein
MIRKIFILLICTTYPALNAYAQSLGWVKQISGSDCEKGDKVVFDDSGNVYTIGQYTYLADFDPGPGVFNLPSVFYGGYISKLDAAGNFVWAKALGEGGGTALHSIAIDKFSNVYVTGLVTDSIDLDPGLGSDKIYTPNCWNTFIVKLNALGEYDWGIQLGGQSGQVNYPKTIALDSIGNVYTIGQFQDTIDFDPGPGIFNLISPYFYDVFVYKLDPNGNLIWAKSFGGGYHQAPSSACIDKAGNVYIQGVFEGISDFDPGINVYSLTNVDSTDIFICKLNYNGGFVWAKSIGNNGLDLGLSIDVDSFGNVYTHGLFSGTLDFDPGPNVYNLTAVGLKDFFICKLNSSGNFVWAKVFGSAVNERWSNMVVDNIGNVYTAGSFNGTTDFDPGPGTFNLTTIGYFFVGNSDIFISKLSPSGNYLWAKQIGSVSAFVFNRSIITDNSGNMYLTGEFGAPVDFDTGPGTHIISGIGCYDTYVVKYTPCLLSNTGTATITSCNPYTWIDGITYFESNSTATYPLVNVAGCDSVVTLNLTIATDSVEEFISVCNSFTWIDGNTYTVSNNTATFTMANSLGCDSVISLNLLINADDVIDVRSACDSITWIDGNVYTVSNNTATYVLSNSYGCDSLIHLNLDMHYSAIHTDVIATCDTYTWIDGNTYNSSNATASYIMTTSAGCDSTVYLNLTVNYSNSGIDSISDCSAHTWIDGNTYTTSNYTATHTIINASGCDSTITLNLTLYNENVQDVITACEPFVWIDGNTYFTSNNTATYSLTNTAGCDSVITLNLTFINLNVNEVSGNLIAEQTGALYQWIDCNNNNVPITNANNIDYYSTVDGNYAVIITLNNCSDTSACNVVTPSGINDNLLSNLIIYPNPSNKELYLSNVDKIKGYQLTQLDGKLIMQGSIFPIYIENLSEGFYFIKLFTIYNKEINLKIIKN